MTSVEGRGRGEGRVAGGADPAELLRIHDELDRLTPSGGFAERVRTGVIVTAAAWASWMVVGTAADLGVGWPFGLALGLGWAVSLGITVARRLRVRALRRRLREAEGGAELGGPASG